MKRRLVVLSALACLASAAALAGSSHAAIDSTTGQVQQIAPPAGVLFPPHPGESCPTAGACLASDTTMFAFNERQCVAAPTNLPVDITQPGTYDDSGDLTNGGTIAAGTIVSSHLVHSEQATPNHGPALDFDGTIHTDGTILGIAILAPALDATDVLGAPGTLYPTGVFGRALNLDGQDDFVVNFVDGHTVEVHSQVNLHADQVRVITTCPRATIIVRKVTVPSGAPVQFNFTGDAAGTIGDGQTITVGNLLPGTYSSQEQVPAGWTLTGLSCDDSDSTGNLGTATATFHVSAGEVVTCTFTDTTNERIGRQGLTLGYWKNHTSVWAIYKPTDTFDSVFGVGVFPSSFTLLQALQQGGGGVNALGRQAVAALLNATSPSLDYPLYSWQVIQLVHDAIVSGNATTIENLKNQLEGYNSLSG
jgi:hypothetical protein